MHYQEPSRRRSILGGFALGAMLGAGVALLLAPRPAARGDAVRRARELRDPAPARPRPRGGAAGRMAKRRFSL